MQEFLSQNNIVATEEVNAKKLKWGAGEALKLLKDADRLFAAKRSKVTIIDLTIKDRPVDEELLAHMLGPTGNLRAPTLRVGKSIVVGFNLEMFTRIFNSRKKQ